jgi:DNA polymerase I
MSNPRTSKPLPPVATYADWADPQRCIALGFPPNWREADPDSLQVAIAEADSVVRWVIGKNNIAAALAPYPVRVYYDSIEGQLAEKRFGIPPARNYVDLQIAAHLLDENRLNFHKTLKSLIPQSHLGLNTAADGEALREMDRDIAMQVSESNMLWRGGIIPDLLQQQGLQRVFCELNMPVATVCAEMMAHGISLDSEKLVHYQKLLISELDQLQLHIQRLTREKNFTYSITDACRLLFKKLKLLPGYRWQNEIEPLTPDVLHQIEDRHPVVLMIQQFWQKLELLERIDMLAKDYNSATGRIYPRLSLVEDPLGGFSYENPDLAQLPPELTRFFRPELGRQWLYAYYPDLDLRVLGHIAQDPVFCRAFFDGRGDIHRQTAAFYFRKNPEALNDREYLAGKELNHVYVTDGIEREFLENGEEWYSASQGLTDLAEHYPVLHKWMRSTIDQARCDHQAVTLFGRRRHLPWLAKSPNLINLKPRERPVYSLIRGSAYEILKSAMLRLRHGLPSDCRILYTQGHGILLEVPTGQSQSRAEDILRIMQEAPIGFTVPLSVEINGGFAGDIILADPVADEATPHADW